MQFLIELGRRYLFIRAGHFEAYVGRGVTGRWEWSVDVVARRSA